MNVLIVGGGGREHALAWKLRQSPRVQNLYVAPGNGGTRHIAENIPIAITHHHKLAHFAKNHAVDLAVIGPDNPLADGIVDVFESYDIPTFGPRKSAFRIEGSKASAKQFMQEENIPTAEFEVFSDFEGAKKYLYQINFPTVVKADGLALGKGVYVCDGRDDAEQAIRRLMIEGIHGDAGKTVVIERRLRGTGEMSVHALSDGENALLFPGSCDFKRLLDDDRGPNTGGMGCITSSKWGEIWLDDIKKTIVMPALRGLRERGRPFVGCLYPGVMLMVGGPMVLEFNARFGDPETQGYMRILKSDLFELLNACVHGTLAEHTAEWEPSFCISIVLASRGYPNTSKLGFPITGIENAESDPNIVVFHAGTVYESGELKTAGGRVLTVTATAPTYQEATLRAYTAVCEIHFDGMQYRTDIGIF